MPDGKRTFAAQGRQGKGLIYVFAAGNDKPNGDNCGGDQFVSSIYTISVAICNYRGEITSYSERCPGIMVTAYGASVSIHKFSLTRSQNKNTLTIQNVLNLNFSL